MAGRGRGRGDGPDPDSEPEVPAPGPSRTSSGSSSSDEKTVRGRGGFRDTELRTIPPNITNVKANPTAVATMQAALLHGNYVRLTRIDDKRAVYKYRVDFEPDIELVSLRKRLFGRAWESLFPGNRPDYDGVHDARSANKTASELTTKTIPNPQDPSANFEIKIKRVGTVDFNSFELLRLYNFHMKEFLDKLGFWRVSKSGAYVNSSLITDVGANKTMCQVRGFRTASNIHDGGNILMNLEPCHKLLQKDHVLQYMSDIREHTRTGNLQEALKNALIGKLIVAKHNKMVYKVEDIDFSSNPRSLFTKKNTGAQISYVDYFREAYNENILDVRQPLLLVTNNNKRREQQEQGQIKLVPELCNIAGLTNEQRNDTRVKQDMIRASQVSPNDRLIQLMDFINKLNSNTDIRTILQSWGYRYGDGPVKIKGHILPTTKIGVGQASKGNPDNWPASNNDGGFDNIVCRNQVATPNIIPEMAIVITRANESNQQNILDKLANGFSRVGFKPAKVTVAVVQNDSNQALLQMLRSRTEPVLLIIIPRQDKEKYDTIKKYCAVEKGVISQVVTAKLMLDDRKAAGAATKIAIQVCAKHGGEPWLVHIPMAGAMICGYDTYHDTADRGKSFGAFVASMNAAYSKWWSKSDKHDKIDELSTHLAENVAAAMRKYKERDPKGQYPSKIFIYRDGVSDGQIEHVYQVEIKTVKKAIKDFSPTSKLAFIIVNKRIGARFYMKQDKIFVNPTPGCVVDDCVTRQERYDFYLISQSTRFGTVTPTYYNIIYDDIGFPAERHQQLAFKLCSMYYNWTGTVRVPAPCQYAHKLALLCGEHLHSIPNARLDDNLHFL